MPSPVPATRAWASKAGSLAGRQGGQDQGQQSFDGMELEVGSAGAGGELRSRRDFEAFEHDRDRASPGARPHGMDAIRPVLEGQERRGGGEGKGGGRGGVRRAPDTTDYRPSHARPGANRIKIATTQIDRAPMMRSGDDQRDGASCIAESRDGEKQRLDGRQIRKHAGNGWG
jgi:hypothetical protein